MLEILINIMSNDYFEERQIEYTMKLRQVVATLPDIFSEFFIGIENRTSVLTRLQYAYDLKIFYDYLLSNVAKFEGVTKDTFDINILRRITSTDIEVYLSYLNYRKVKNKVHTNSLKTKARKLASLKTFFKYFYCKGQLDSDPAARVLSFKLHDKAIIRLENNEVDALLKSVESGECVDSKRQFAYYEKTRKRDIAILTLLLGTGIRVSECVGLNIDDIDFNVNGFKITRKGGNQTVLYFSEEVEYALREYLEERKADINIIDNPALFLSLQNKRIGVRAVEILVKKYTQSVTPLKNITPHKLRSTYGTALYRATNDIYVVAEVLGHKDLNTTKRHYAAMSDEIKRAAASKVVLRSSEDDDFE